jgi:hypothetical protein
MHEWDPSIHATARVSFFMNRFRKLGLFDYNDRVVPIISV